MPSDMITRAGMLLGLATLACGGATDTLETARSGDSSATTGLIVELRIGLAEGASEYVFGYLTDVAATANGTIFAADDRLKELRRYDADGRFLGVVSREGEGPGEYTRLWRVEALPDGWIAVRAGGHRVLVFDEAGANVADFRVAHARGGSAAGLEAGTDGSLYVPIFDPESFQTERDWRHGRSPTHLVRLNQDGEALERIPLLPPEPSHQGWVMPRAEGTLEPFIVSTLQAWSPLGYLAVGRNDEYSIRLDVPDGPAIEVRRVVPRVLLEDSERESWLLITQKVQKVYDTQVPLDARWSMERAEEEHIPDLKPYFRDIRIDDDGRIWVHRHVEAELWDPPPSPPQPGGSVMPWREPPTFDVFAPDGTFLDTVVLPRLTRFTQARGDTLWGIQEDMDGVQYVVRMRLDPPLGSPTE